MVTEPGFISVVNSATSGLTAALIASGVQPGLTCIMPALTFAASPAAARAARLEPAFADVDPQSLMITPLSIMPTVNALGGTSKVGAIMPVSLYGATIDVESWAQFSEETGVPVILDAAWCFDTVQASALPTVVSMHATKVFGVGEGGLVLCTSEEFIDRVNAASNFGLDETRVANSSGINAKMSEYGAAVGLASLDAWPLNRSKSIKLAASYHNQLSRLPGLDIVNDVDGTWAPGTVLIRFKTHLASLITNTLAEKNIEARHWWGALCNEHAVNRNSFSHDLSVSQTALPSLMNLPFSLDMSSSVIEEVVSEIGEAMMKLDNT